MIFFVVCIKQVLSKFEPQNGEKNKQFPGLGQKSTCFFFKKCIFISGYLQISSYRHKAGLLVKVTKSGIFLLFFGRRSSFSGASTGQR